MELTKKGEGFNLNLDRCDIKVVAPAYVSLEAGEVESLPADLVLLGMHTPDEYPKEMDIALERDEVVGLIDRLHSHQKTIDAGNIPRICKDTGRLILPRPDFSASFLSNRIAQQLFHVGWLEKIDQQAEALRELSFSL